MLFALLLPPALACGCSSVVHTSELEVERPVEVVWAVFADDARLGEWLHDSWAHGAVPWAGSRGASVGVASPVLLTEDGEVMHLTQTITALAAPETFAFELEHAWMDMENRFTLEPRGAGASTLRWTAVIRPHGFWRRVVVNLWRPSIRARYEDHLGRLGALVEAEPAR